MICKTSDEETRKRKNETPKAPVKKKKKEAAFISCRYLSRQPLVPAVENKVKEKKNRHQLNFLPCRSSAKKNKTKTTSPSRTPLTESQTTLKDQRNAEKPKYKNSSGPMF